MPTSMQRARKFNSSTIADTPIFWNFAVPAPAVAGLALQTTDIPRLYTFDKKDFRVDAHECIPDFDQASDGRCQMEYA